MHGAGNGHVLRTGHAASEVQPFSGLRIRFLLNMLVDKRIACRRLFDVMSTILYYGCYVPLPVIFLHVSVGIILFGLSVRWSNVCLRPALIVFAYLHNDVCGRSTSLFSVPMS